MSGQGPPPPVPSKRNVRLVSFFVLLFRFMIHFVILLLMFHSAVVPCDEVYKFWYTATVEACRALGLTTTAATVSSAK
jgi:hypothetical protein